MTPRRRASALLPLLPLALAACTGGDLGAVSESAARDSAGVRIVENARPAWPADSGWRVAAEPSLSIGAEEGDAALLLSRVFSAVRLSDGRIVVADGGSSQLRFFDARGRFLSASGGSGEGPGEFEFLNRVWRRRGDTIAATDISPRISYFDAQGRYAHAVQVTPAAGMRRANVVAQADDGTFLAMSGSRGFGRADQGRVIHDTIQLFRLTPDGATGSLLGRLPGQERWGLHTAGVTSFPFLAFSSPSSYAAGTDRFVAGSGRTGEVSVWRPDGALASLVRWPAERRPVTPELLDRFREHRLNGETDPNERRRVEQFLAEAPVADTLPVYQSLLVDELGHLWVEEYRPPWEREPAWQVFDPHGRWLGRVRTPARLRIFQIGEDFVLGRWMDGNDVEHVRVYPLEKSR